MKKLLNNLPIIKLKSYYSNQLTRKYFSSKIHFSNRKEQEKEIELEKTKHFNVNDKQDKDKIEKTEKVERQDRRTVEYFKKLEEEEKIFNSNQIQKRKSNELNEDFPIYNRNFKSLTVDCYESTCYLIDNFDNVKLKQLTDIFCGTIIKTQNFSNNLNEFIENIGKTFPYLNKNQINKTYLSLIYIYEFLDRGMKGFLTGDICLSTIINMKKFLEKGLEELKNEEKEYEKLDLNVNDFYESVFKIDNSLYSMNKSDNLIINLSKIYENTGVFSNKLMYYVNLKHTQFANKLKDKLDYVVKSSLEEEDKKNHNETEELKSNSIKIDEIYSQIEEKKNIIQGIFNSIYNNILNSLDDSRIPKNGIQYPENENPSNLFRRQLLVEEFSFIKSTDKFNSLLKNLQENDKSHELSINKDILNRWNKVLTITITQIQKDIIINKSYLSNSREYMKYFLSLQADEISTICILYIIKLILASINLNNNQDDKEHKYYSSVKEDISNIEDLSFKACVFVKELGKQIILEIKNTKLEGLLKGDVNKRIISSFQNLNQTSIIVSEEIKYKLGMLLLQIMCRNLKFVYENNSSEDGIVLDSKINYDDIDSVNTNSSLNTENKEINLMHLMSQRDPSDGKIYNLIVINKYFLSQYLNYTQKIYSTFCQLTNSLPMIYPPMPWKNKNIGSYYLRHTTLSKVNTDFKEVKDTYENTNLNYIMKSLDNLGSVKWRINNKILDVVDYIWANGGGKGGIPARFNEKMIKKMDIKNAKTFKEKIYIINEVSKNRNAHSLRSDFQIKLNIAKNFSKVKEIYFPHNIDYRGRCYPLSPHLNHIGNDLCRGLLEYAESKPLGKDGLNWLKIHLANVMGKDKLSHAERIKYSDSIIDLCHKVNNDPYNNQEWLEVDSPWQALSTMFELSNAVKSKNPSKYITNLHCHVDGSCNGLQHYSALSRDYNGGYEVNLINREKPGDVYTKVLHICLDKIKTETNPKFKEIANLLIENDIINRKVVKQTVMTSVYGVTLIGAKNQIKKQLNEKKGIDLENIHNVSLYLAMKVLESIGDLFKEADKIKTWLAKCAFLIGKTNRPVKWLTPLNLPCIQPYKRINDVNIIRTHSQGTFISEVFDLLPINISKQSTAFPPNFVHSLDSSHMMLTCNRAFSEGIVFASVHDSYWAHPCDITKLNKILREEFVYLYNKPILQNLEMSFKMTHPEINFPPLPSVGSFDLNEVLKSEYFFS